MGDARDVLRGGVRLRLSTLSTLFTLWPLCSEMPLTKLHVMDSSNSALQMMPLSSTYALSYTKFNQMWLLVHHGRVGDCGGGWGMGTGGDWVM